MIGQGERPFAVGILLQWFWSSVTLTGNETSVFCPSPEGMFWGSVTLTTGNEAGESLRCFRQELYEHMGLRWKSWTKRGLGFPPQPLVHCLLDINTSRSSTAHRRRFPQGERGLKSLGVVGAVVAFGPISAKGAYVRVNDG